MHMPFQESGAQCFSQCPYNIHVYNPFFVERSSHTNNFFQNEPFENAEIWMNVKLYSCKLQIYQGSLMLGSDTIFFLINFQN